MKKIFIAAPHYFSSYVQVGGHHYAKALSRNNWRVMYISNYLSPFNLLMGKERKDIRFRFLNHLRGGERINTNLFSYVPFSFLPHHNYTVFDRKWFLDNCYRFTLPSVTGYLKKHRFDSVDILWVEAPSQTFWKGVVKHTKSIYRVFDKIEEFHNTGSVLLDAHEEAILSSDLVIVTSKALINDLKEKYRQVFFLYCPNGVDLSNFMRDRYYEPEEYRGIKGKKAIYVGAIDEWFDERLLTYVAARSPEIHFYVIGPDRLGKMSSVKENNIHYLGPKPFEDIPDYIFYADFGIIPFKSNRLVRCVSPIKMYEYFSLGKQVVSTSWEELTLLEVPCLLAEDRTSFLEFVNSDQVLYPDKQQLIRYAEENTWENRLSDIFGLL